jgi:hypothetical protein
MNTKEKIRMGQGTDEPVRATNPTKTPKRMSPSTPLTIEALRITGFTAMILTHGPNFVTGRVVFSTRPHVPLEDRASVA